MGSDMKILILGGTQFVGRHITEYALQRGHEVTLFNRGKTNSQLFPEAEKLIGDRDGGLDALRGRRWDAVVDVNGYLPRIVGDSARLLADSVDHYTFISTISVYAEPYPAVITEDSPLEEIGDDVPEDPSRYGGMKILCERAAENAMPNRVLVIRPGLIVGPYDPTFRFNYWLSKVAEGEEMIAPGTPHHPAQFIDVRDLAEWTIHMMEGKQTGIYNATGHTLTMGEVLDQCQVDISPDAVFTWLDETFLLENDVTPFQELPFWLPESAWGILRLQVDKAVAAGLSFRSLQDTLIDTLPFAQQMAANLPESNPWGMNPEREDDLLAKWHQHSKSRG
jgi:2'-hydroxyisoflavone reductase